LKKQNIAKTFVLEACLRLALKEGQKERTLEKQSGGLKMYRKTITVVLVLAMIVSLTAMNNVLALGPSGTCYSKDSYEENQNDYPRYSECEHSNLGQADDMMVGLGVTAQYDLGQETPLFNWGTWQFLNEAGYSGNINPDSPVEMAFPVVCTFCLDYGLPNQYYYNYYYYADPIWLYISEFDYYCWYASCYSQGYIADWHSVEGVTQGQFYYLDEPENYYYMWAYTQIPSGHSAPVQSFAFLTAHQTGDW
jgi:hypothetical protein